MRKLLLVFMASVVSSCATIVKPSTYVYKVESNPPGATFEITDRSTEVVRTGITPDTVQLPSLYKFFQRQEYSIKLKKEGYQTSIVPVNYNVEGWYWGNFFSWGIIGFLVVDPGSGAMYSPARRNISETMQALSGESGEITITVGEPGPRKITEQEKEEIVNSDDMY